MTYLRIILLPLAGCALLACEPSLKVGSLTNAPGAVAILQEGEGERGTGWWPNVQFDTEDRPHVVYCDAEAGKIRYATRHEGRWAIQTPIQEGNVGKYATLQLDQHGRVGIGFYDQDALHLKYLYQADNGEWAVEKVAWGLETGIGAALRYDANNRAHLFYYNPSGKLIQAERTAADTWKKTIIDEATAGFSARISPHWRSDGFWISFVNERLRLTTLFLAHPEASGAQPYQFQKIDDKHTAGWRSDLLFSGEHPYVYFSRGYKKTLYRSLQSQGQWVSTLLARDVGNFVAAAGPSADATDDVIVYQNVREQLRKGGKIMLLRQVGERWQHEVIDAAGWAGDYLALAVNSKGQAMAAYTSKDVRGLRIYDETGESQTVAPSALNADR